MNKKVVVLGGGTGMSTLLRGLKQFPVDITAIVSVSDDGKSTGKIREEFKTPALGDIRRVLASLSETEPLFEKVLNYRFNTNGSFNGHTVGNLLLVAMSEITGSVSTGIESLSSILNLKGKVLPLTEESNNTLVAEMEDGNIIEGEHNITNYDGAIKSVWFKDKTEVTKESIKAIKEADLIILSMGSLYTSIIPTLICKEIKDAIDAGKGKVLYVCNMMTQPGETDNFKVSDHVKVLNKYLGKKKISTVIANKGFISKTLSERYHTLEQKDPVLFDEEELKKLNVKIIAENFVTIEEEWLRHDVIKVSLHIFSCLL
ncbi:MAG: YvcK family protein [Firmicutes bacterium]|nr:YvcK family protein [Bacillota bacterium]